MPVTAVELTLQRPAPGPWGLRLQGGLDYDKALVISHVTEGTHSSLSGLMVQYNAMHYSNVIRSVIISVRRRPT